MVGRAPGCATVDVNKRKRIQWRNLNTEQHTHHALLTLRAHALPCLLQGRKAKFVPGWDCHGLPIELKVGKHGGRCMAGAVWKTRPARWRC